MSRWGLDLRLGHHLPRAVAAVGDVAATGGSGAHQPAPAGHALEERPEDSAGLPTDQRAEHRLGAELRRHSAEPNALAGRMPVDVVAALAAPLDRHAEHRAGGEDRDSASCTRAPVRPAGARRLGGRGRYETSFL
jgi:hypothetical protein